MTWESKTMPDDAPELAGSLVGSMLGVEPVSPKPTSNDRQIRSSGPLPLWQALHDAHEQEAGSIIDGLGNTVLGEPDRFTRAAEIEALRDWLVPDKQEPVSSNLLEAVGHREWKIKQALRCCLTEQARIARGEQ